MIRQLASGANPRRSSCFITFTLPRQNRCARLRNPSGLKRGCGEQPEYYVATTAADSLQARWSRRRWVDPCGGNNAAGKEICPVPEGCQGQVLVRLRLRFRIRVALVRLVVRRSSADQGACRYARCRVTGAPRDRWRLRRSTPFFESTDFSRETAHGGRERRGAAIVAQSVSRALRTHQPIRQRDEKLGIVRIPPDGIVAGVHLSEIEATGGVPLDARRDGLIGCG